MNLPYIDILPGSLPDFITYPQKNSRVTEDGYYADIINHCDSPNLGDSRATNAHETTHYINNDIRNNYAPNDGKYNGFYVGDSCGVVVPEPNFSKSEVAQFIPSVLQSYRFSTYVSGQSGWNDRPLYLFDEWTAYINDSIVSIQDYQNGNAPRMGLGERYDGIGGPLEFSIYCIGLGMAILKYDPEYWKTQLPFQRFYYFLHKRSEILYQAGRSVPIFMMPKEIVNIRLMESSGTSFLRQTFPVYDPPIYWNSLTNLVRDDSQRYISPDDLLNNLRTHPDAQSFRGFINTYLAGVWLT